MLSSVADKRGMGYDKDIRFDYMKGLRFGK